MSAVMSDQSSNNVAELFSPGPGERLRAARLSMGYDLAKIASELHLTILVVEALEADDYHNVGARVFARGYLRNYARIVGMPVESILRQFDEKWPDDGALHSMVKESPTLPADGGPSRGWAGAMTWLMVIGLIALFLMWWRGYLDEIVPQQIRASNVVDGLKFSVGTASEDMGALEPPPDNAVVPQEGGLRLPAPSPASDQQPSARGATDSLALPPASAGVGESEPLSTKPPGSTQETASALVPQAPAAPAQLPDATSADSAGRDGEGAPVVDGSKQVVITFNAPSWVDVRDSERKFKLFGEVSKGSRKVLGGQPPYKMVIGNAQAVSITVNGEPFDLAPYAKGNVARFTLDP